ncbi:membrane hypothetical protein [metagenome]|uniref:Uncharacterized protein n=1 Tax=metagenome TaxID=256318 RepID=A0A2P2CHN3_9ZZZZ
MNVEEGLEQGTPPLPTEIKVLAWASVASQVALLVRQGLRVGDDISLLLSMAGGALVVGYVSAGVVRARPVRVALAWIVLVLSLVAELIGLAYVDALGDAAIALAHLATTVVSLVALYGFSRTGWYAWQRTRPPTHLGAPIGELVVLGALVGVLGGLAGTSEDGANVTMNVRVAER